MHSLLQRLRTISICAPIAIFLLRTPKGISSLLFCLHALCIEEGFQLLSKMVERHVPSITPNTLINHSINGRDITVLSRTFISFDILKTISTVKCTFFIALAYWITSYSFIQAARFLVTFTLLDMYISHGYKHLLLIAHASFPQAVFFSLVVWNFDTASLLTGKTFKHLFPDSSAHFLFKPLRSFLDITSPNKTVPGVFGGIFFGAVLTSVILSSFPYFALPSDSSPYTTGLIMGVLSLFGDLFQSGLKRLAGVKDSGSFFPGHGGALDRMDSMLFTSIWFYHAIVKIQNTALEN